VHKEILSSPTQAARFTRFCGTLSAHYFKSIYSEFGLQPLSLFIGRRYLRAKRQNNFISFISLVSMAGIALGIAALITVLSVMNGFQKEVRAKILGVTSHIQVMGFDAGLTNWRDVVDATKPQSDIAGAAPFVMGQGMLTTGQTPRGIGVRGIDPAMENEVADLGTNMKVGALSALKPGEYGIVLGSELSRALQAQVGTRLQLVVASGGGPSLTGTMGRQRSFTVVGIFSSGHYEYDLNLALIHIKDAQTLFRLDDAVSGVRLKVNDTDRAPLIARELGKTLKIDGYVTDWTQQNATYFRAVQIEKRMMFIILTLIIAVAAFNLVSTLVMVVTDKHPDIAILRTLGATPGTIMRIFIVQGAMVGLIGTLIGVVGGVLLALNISDVVSFMERIIGTPILSPEVYFIKELPSDLKSNDVWSISLIAFAMALVATLYPSWRASKVNPAEALRYE
jgi:lipoprotein-releasing system permease protein